ncbi:MAG: ABC transporter [Candidatus Magasanikbacteria bacterium CG10_big_fil_rev_8_21_14_0_10_40_10]|uniref:ABC transporter n=1 Tax=Candidatus Magasanikbacteria bacterium CG10_big_fil_rev_8_21_14_0_10_40_10 TaxID=1974648 RepID=A0A2M6W4P2_9BACT|nr:MAG: ABC transporter [Candidatus Magasanikbacteria bacterium CG10_big_fil_rev_8_21_14_0_10_40_10]
MWEILQYPFMVRALISGIFIAVLLGWLGTFVVTRKMSLIGDGIAHASLASIALALLLGLAPIPVAVVLAIFIAVFIYFLEKKTKISSDMAIAVMFTTGMAIGIILLHFYQGYQPELVSYLFGNILTINNYDLGNIIFIGLVILVCLFIFYRKILFSTFDPIGAYLSGIKPWKYDLILYISTAVAIILSIKLIGIILVSALLVTPSAIAKLFSRSFKHFTVLAIIISALIVFIGLLASYYLDLPSGAVIVLTGTLIFLLSFVIKNIIRMIKKNNI